MTVDDIELYYESHGSGAPLVLIGGLGSSVAELGGLIDPLSQRFRVIAPDNRGAGKSAKPPGPYSIPRLAQDVVGLLDALAVPRAHVLGISLGGRIAMTLALDHAARVDRLILVSTVPRAAGARWLVRLGMRFASRGGQPRHALQAQFDATTTFDCTARLPEITAPTLIVHGRKDRVAPLAIAKEMATAIPNARTAIVNGGHAFMYLPTKRTFLLAQTEKFLDEPSP